MSINGMLFLFVFLPISFLIFYLVRGKARDYVLLLISLIFYALGSIRYIVLFSVSIFLTILIGRGIAFLQNKTARKILLILGILLNSGILVFYKYLDFVLQTYGRITSGEVAPLGLALPLGISFFTFKAISYLADVYTGKAELSKNPVEDALYLSFFAQIQSGPLSRYNEMRNSDHKKFDFELFSDGVYRFLIGFNKKVLLANVLSNITTEIFATPFDRFSTGYAWLGSVCYSLQLFFDFAGYSDMAIGLTEMFGYRCKENFNFPYMTESVTRFWRRWHISLSEWFRDYIYIPLGGSRTKHQWQVYFNLFVVWLLTGIWHGANWNFIAWGLGYFVVIAFERFTNLPGRIKSTFGKVIYRVLSLLFINFQWVLFNSKDIASGLRYIKKMIIFTTNDVADVRTLYLMKDYGLFIALAILLCFPVVGKLDEHFAGRRVASKVYESVKMLLIIAAFVWAASFVVAGQNNPFAYANF